MKKTPARGDASASAQLDARIAELGDWRGATLARVRAVIHAAVPDVVETWKWMGTPCFEKDGILCTGETYKQVVKLTFPKGAALRDPAKLFNASLEGNARRAIDFREGDALNEKALAALLLEAVLANQEKGAKKKAGAGKAAGATKASAKKPATKAAGAKKPAGATKAAGAKKTTGAKKANTPRTRS